MELRPYQQQALDDIRASVRGGVRRLVVQAATGAGKTLIAAAIVHRAMEKGNRMAFVVPAISLVDQTLESFWEQGIRDVGVIQANHMLTNWEKPVQVCSIQTIQSRGAFPEAKAVIFDECHRMHEAHKTWMSHPDWKDVPMIGLSATPWTRGMGKYFDSLLIAATTKDLIEKGYLSKFKVFATGHPDLSEVKTVAGDYHEKQLSEAMQKGGLTADIVRTWQEKWGRDKTLCFGVDKAHAKLIQERFEFAGIRCGYQDADTTQDERREIKRKFHNGEYQVVSNIQTLTTGVDWDVRCLILARPTKSEMLYVQIIGRALRTAIGKDHAIILDHSDTTARLGFVTEIHHEELDDGKPKEKAIIEKKEPLPQECKQCTYLKPPKTKICPNCGHETTIRSEILEADGELVELIPGRRIKKLSHEWSERELKQFYAELRQYAMTKQYKTGWAAAKYKSRFGKWPPYSWKDQPTKPYSPAVEAWVRSTNIAWANRKREGKDVAAAPRV